MNKLLNDVRDGKQLSLYNKLVLIVQLSLPAIMAQITTTAMEYIDASMVGRLGASNSASIGLVSSTTWLLSGACSALGIGFTVQIAQLIGAKKEKEARQVMMQGLWISLGLSFVLALIGIGCSFILPSALGAEKSICWDANLYLLIYSLSLPFYNLNFYCGGSLQSSGNMKIPSFLNVCMCFLDVIFNYFFIFVFHLGVMGAAMGTALSHVVVSVIMAYFLFSRSEMLRIRKEEKVSWYGPHLKRACRIGIPAAVEQTISTSTYILMTAIVAPLGTIAIAANSFSITAEGLCYMPGYGIAAAASTLVGQSLGAGRQNLTKSLGRLTVVFGTLLMALSGVLLYFCSPFMISLITPDLEIQALSVEILRIEAFAEALFGASIVCTGVFRGAGDTLMATVLNFLSMWCVRLPLAWYLSLKDGLRGVWIAMAIELCFRGILFLIRLFRNGWLKRYVG